MIYYLILSYVNTVEDSDISNHNMVIINHLESFYSDLAFSNSKDNFQDEYLGSNLIISEISEKN